jgi:uncharacterized transporter YbjL
MMMVISLLSALAVVSELLLISWLYNSWKFVTVYANIFSLLTIALVVGFLTGRVAFDLFSFALLVGLAGGVVVHTVVVDQVRHPHHQPTTAPV